MNSILNRWVIGKFTRSLVYCFRRCKTTSVLQYDLSEEIVVGKYEKVFTIGINYPQVSNSLNDNALDQLNQKFIDFDNNDNYSVAVLHGFGGNFCTGIQESTSLEKAEKLLKTLSKLKKPTVASLSGHTYFYGFELAIMCDFRIMEMNAIFGRNHGVNKGKLFPISKERLVERFNSQCVSDLIISGTPLNYAESSGYGLIAKWTETGAALGKALNFALSVSKFPLEEIIEDKAWLRMVYNRKINK